MSIENILQSFRNDFSSAVKGNSTFMDEGLYKGGKLKDSLEEYFLDFLSKALTSLLSSTQQETLQAVRERLDSEIERLFPDDSITVGEGTARAFAEHIKDILTNPPKES